MILQWLSKKKRAKAAWKGSGEQATDDIWFEIQDECGATEFLGYEVDEAQAKVVAIIADGKRVEKVAKGAAVSIILNQTPFYGESGGQEGDWGSITSDDGFDLQVEDTRKFLGKLHIHMGKVRKGSIKNR